MNTLLSTLLASENIDELSDALENHTFGANVEEVELTENYELKAIIKYEGRYGISASDRMSFFCGPDWTIERCLITTQEWIDNTLYGNGEGEDQPLFDY